MCLINVNEISLANLFKGEKIDVVDPPTDLDFIIERIIIGGFPTLLNKTIGQATDLNRAYVELLAEVDSIVQKYNGDWCAFEIKLGTGQIDEAAAVLTKFASTLDTSKVKPPTSLNIATGTGISYTRSDGINVVSLASLGE